MASTRSVLGGGRRLLLEVVAVHRIGGYRCSSRFVRGILTNLGTVLRTATLEPADRAMMQRSWRFRVLGTEIELDGEAFAGAREMYGRGVYFALPGFRLSPGDIVVDLGANQGLFSILAAKLGATAIAVEAQSGFVELIQAAARRNRCEERVTTELALVGSGGMLRDEEALRRTSHFGGVPQRLTMDELMRRCSIERIDFLKVDIEGAEFGLFTPEASWLDRVGKIAMEVHCEHGDPRALATGLERRGFEVRLLGNDRLPVSELTGAGGYLFARRK